MAAEFKYLLSTLEIFWVSSLWMNEPLNGYHMMTSFSVRFMLLGRREAGEGGGSRRLKSRHRLLACWLYHVAGAGLCDGWLWFGHGEWGRIIVWMNGWVVGRQKLNLLKVRLPTKEEVFIRILIKSSVLSSWSDDISARTHSSASTHANHCCSSWVLVAMLTAYTWQS